MFLGMLVLMNKLNVAAAVFCFGMGVFAAIQGDVWITLIDFSLAMINVYLGLS